jgi:hypothetical protein
VFLGDDVEISNFMAFYGKETLLKIILIVTVIDQDKG